MLVEFRRLSFLARWWAQMSPPGSKYSALRLHAVRPLEIVNDQPRIRSGSHFGDTSRFALTSGCHLEISALVSSKAASRSSFCWSGRANGTESFWPIFLDLLVCCAASDFRNVWRVGSVREDKMSSIDKSFDASCKLQNRRLLPSTQV